ncbi:MAG: response regulator transcription factor [Pirellulales bacterium]
MDPIRVLLVDDQVLFRDGLRKLLSVQRGLEVVGEAADGAQAIEKIRELAPDIVLMDLRMKVMSGVEATRRLKAEFPECRVIVLTTFDDDDDVFAALRAGAIGYLLKDAPTDRLVEAIQLAHQGESVLQPSVAAKVVAEFSRSPAKSSEQLVEIESLLSDREFVVLRHLVGGLSNKEIAKQMRISEGTVKNYMTSILDKLGVQDRTQAALKAQAAGLAP